MKQIYRAEIERINWQGEPAVCFRAGGYEALLVPGIGANVIALKDLKYKLSLLRTPDDIKSFRQRPQAYGIPILFPPNRIADGTFKAGDRTYKFPINSTYNNHIHGFLLHKKFVVSKMDIVSEDVAEVEVCYFADESTDFFKHFPHQFEIRLLYKLSPEGLEQTIYVSNKSDSPMPLGLGYHTSFSMPFSASGKAEDYRLKASVHKRWELDERKLPTGNMMPLNDEEMDYRKEGLSNIDRPISAHYSAASIQMDGSDFNGIVLEDTGRGVSLFYEVGKEFRHWMFWNMGGENGFICLEPQTWVINAPNVKLPDDVTGMQLIEPSDTWKASCKIYTKEIL